VGGKSEMHLVAGLLNEKRKKMKDVSELVTTTLISVELNSMDCLNRFLFQMEILPTILLPFLYHKVALILWIRRPFSERKYCVSTVRKTRTNVM
jgi:hypothetical protein